MTYPSNIPGNTGFGQNGIQNTKNTEVKSYGDYEDDFGMGDDMGLEIDSSASPDDEFFGMDEGSDLGDPAPAAQTLNDLRQEVKRLEALLEESDFPSEKNRPLIAADLKVLKGRVNEIAALAPEDRPQAMADLTVEFVALELQITGKYPDGTEDPKMALENELEKTKENVQKNPNLSKANKEKFLKKIEQWQTALTELGITDTETISAELADLKQELTEASLYPAGVQELTDLLPDVDPGRIEEVFDEKGLDFPVDEITPAVIEALAELDPSLKEAINAVKEATQTEMDEAQAAMNAQIQINTANRASTSDADNMDLSHAQKWVDIKHKQHPLSRDTMEAKDAVRKALLPFLEVIMGEDVEVKIPEGTNSNSAQGKYDKYFESDQITVDGVKFDLFDNSTGKLRWSSSADDDPMAGQTIILAYDNEGDGDWDPNINVYGMGGAREDSYDDG